MRFHLNRLAYLGIATVLLLVFPVIAQAFAVNNLDRNASVLARVCDSAVNQMLASILQRHDKELEVSKEVRSSIRPFIDASYLLNDSSVGSGLVEEGNWVHGIALFDANGDNLTDIYILHDNRPPVMNNASLQGLQLGNRLFINLGVGPDGLPHFLETSAMSHVQLLGKKSMGVAVGDYDNAGRLDMYVANGLDGLSTIDPQRTPPGYHQTYGAYNPGEGENTLLHNDGNIPYTLPDGTFPWRSDRVVEVPIFSDRTLSAGVGGGSHETESATWVDIDNDGWLDLYVVNFMDVDFLPMRYIGQPAQYPYYGEKNILYHNNRDGTFTDITDKAGVGGTPVPANNPNFKNVSPNYPKDSLGRIVHPAGALSHHAAWYDYDGDGYPDLFVANDQNPIEVFHNNGDLTFTDVTEYTNMKVHGAWMEIGFWDYNGDGKPDLFATNLGFMGFYSPTVYRNGTVVFTDSLGLFRNDGVEMQLIGGKEVPVPKFTWVSNTVQVDWSKVLPPVGLSINRFCHPTIDLSNVGGLTYGEFGWGAIFPDVDNKGRQDLYWVGGLSRCDPAFKTLCLSSPGRLLYNDGNGTFTDISVEAHLLNLYGVNYTTRDRMNLLLAEIGSGLSFGDLRNNGYPDIIVSNKADYTPYAHDPPGSNKGEIVSLPTRLFLNPGGENNWLKVKLVGTKSNRAGIGAQVTVKLQDASLVTKLLLSGDVTAGQTQLDMLFGVGHSNEVTVEVKWPSGNRDLLQNVHTNQMIKITEGGHPAGSNTLATVPIISSSAASWHAPGTPLTVFHQSFTMPTLRDYELSSAPAVLVQLDSDLLEEPHDSSWVRWA